MATLGDRDITSRGGGAGMNYVQFRGRRPNCHKARYASIYALITYDPKIANNPVVSAALVKAKASEAAFQTALENVEAKSNLLRRWSAFRRFRKASIAAEKAHDKLRAAVERVEVEP